MGENGNGWTSWTLARARPYMDAFLEKMRNSGNVRASCQAAGVARSTIYYWRNKYVTFARRWEEAKADAVDILESEAWKRAVQENSDRLLMFLLKAHRREVYGDWVRQEHTGAKGGPVQVDHSGSVQVQIYIPDNGRDDRDPATGGASGDVPE